MVEAKRRVFRWYVEGLAEVPHVSLNREAAWARSIYWMSSLLLHETAPLSRDELMKELKARKVDTRAVFPAISQYPIWPVPQSPQPQALRIGLRAINLPSGVCLSREEVAYVCDQIRELVARQAG
jgi:perosamine synthetase